MVGVFGTVAPGETADRNDVDLLVRFSRPKSLVALEALERQIADALGRNIDLVTEAGISPYLRERILGDLRVICEVS
jgi:predicted nucleotidyltransferase